MSMFEPGSQIGRYEIQRRLGRGGMGTVYVAHDPVLGRMVAIKLFAGDLDMPDARERFAREARAAAALNHPNIVTVYDFGEVASQPYIVMEYVPGDTLAHIIRRKVAASMADKLRWIEDLCAGAGYAHQMSVVHRDIKPANLMLDRSGRLKILDFGIARMLGIASNTSVMIGTPGYMAPEQITGDPVDHRSDQFSIGVVLYELLSYTEPFAGDTLPQITHRIVSQEPTPLEQLVPDINPDLVAIVSQALKKANAQRFKDAETMRQAIARVRRHYESDSDWNTPTMPPVGHDNLHGGGGRGTGSARRKSPDSVGVAQLTPPPDPRRTDREALARRRVQQIDAALMLARTLFEQRKLDEALDACQQALTLDESHGGALQLEEEIQTAIRIREGVEIAADDGAVNPAEGPTIMDPGLSASRLLESQAVTRYHEDAFAFTAPPQTTPEPRQTKPPSAVPVPSNVNQPVSEKTAIRLPAAPADATIIAPARKTPSPVPAPAAMPAAPAVAKAPPQKPATSAKVPEKKKVDRPDIMALARQWYASAVGAIRPATGGASQALRGSTSPAVQKQKKISPLVWGGVGVGVLALAGVGIYLLTRGPAPTGATIIDAVPWATVVAVRNERGESQTLPSPAATPLKLTLPAGTYEVTLAGPPPESRTETVSVRVEVNATALVQAPRFRGVTVDEYFEQYIGAGDAPAPATDATAPAAPPAPASPPASSGGPQ
jgi:serine/threonine-protein kinase